MLFIYYYSYEGKDPISDYWQLEKQENITLFFQYSLLAPRLKCEPVKQCQNKCYLLVLVQQWHSNIDESTTLVTALLIPWYILYHARIKKNY